MTNAFDSATDSRDRVDARSSMTVGDRLGGDPDTVARDLDAILCGNFPEYGVRAADEPEIAARTRAAYSLACKSAFDMIDAIDAAFRAIGHEMKPVLRVGVQSNGDVCAGEMQEVGFTAVEPFQPLWLVVDSDEPAGADYFLILRTMIGVMIQESAADSTPIHASAFARGRCVYDVARFDAMYPGQRMTIEAFNRSGSPRTFRAAIFGRPPKSATKVGDSVAVTSGDGATVR